jgi:hypothetical protein
MVCRALSAQQPGARQEIQNPVRTRRLVWKGPGQPQICLQWRLGLNGRPDQDAIILYFLTGQAPS